MHASPGFRTALVLLQNHRPVICLQQISEKQLAKSDLLYCEIVPGNLAKNWMYFSSYPFVIFSPNFSLQTEVHCQYQGLHIFSDKQENSGNLPEIGWRFSNWILWVLLGFYITVSVAKKIMYLLVVEIIKWGNVYDHYLAVTLMRLLLHLLKYLASSPPPILLQNHVFSKILLEKVVNNKMQPSLIRSRPVRSLL